MLGAPDVLVNCPGLMLLEVTAKGMRVTMIEPGALETEGVPLTGGGPANKAVGSTPALSGQAPSG